MWRMTREDQIIYIFLHSRIMARVHIIPNQYSDARVIACDNLQMARENALDSTEGWEGGGFELDAVYIHHNPNLGITGGLLNARARDIAGHREDCLEILAMVAQAFCEQGEALHD